MSKPTPGSIIPEHRITVLCVDYFAEDRRWVAMCWCNKYKSDRLPTSELAGERGGAHLRAKGAWSGNDKPENGGKATCSVCIRSFRLASDGTVGFHGDGIHYPTRRCDGVGKPPK
jgi:hypothetical protein